MNHREASNHIVNLPRERRGMAAYLDLKTGRHVMYALLEVDVTKVRKYVEATKASTGVQLSFTGYLIYCLARAVEADKSVQAYRKGNTKLVMYDDVDVGFMIEMKRGDARVLRGHVIRTANKKSFREISDEIRAVQGSQIQTDTDRAGWFLAAMQLPWPLSKFFKALFRSIVRYNPTLITSMGGTVGISSVGMFGKGHSGWGISEGTHSLDLVIGGTASRLMEINGRTESREMMSLTIIFDHEVIDGAPATRFTKKLVELIEGDDNFDEALFSSDNGVITESNKIKKAVVD